VIGLIISNVLLFLICLVLVMLLREREKIYREQAADLIDRAMAKNFAEYKEHTTEPKLYEPVALSDEEEWAREQKSLRGE